jgi:FkbM family methyltransferase
MNSMYPALKRASIAVGLYRPARSLHRMLHPTEARNFRGHTQLLSQFVGPGDLAFDVGANIGDRTEILCRLGARVVAFEPQPACILEIRARVPDSSLTLVPSAIGADKGTADLFLAKHSGLASLRSGWQQSESIGKISVPVTTLDNEIAKFGVPRFCKIDVEGFEAEVLEGLSTPIKALSFEYHCDEFGVAKISRCVELLSSLGRYEFNLVGSEESEWLSPKWLKAVELAAAFPACARPHGFGDIFARLA